jgi:protein-S-isoprenylcysteine O-methyltransferase Ste14
VKRRLTAIPAPLVRSFYVWVASVLLIVVVVGWRRIGGTLYDVRGAVLVASAAVQLFGVWLIAKSAGVLDPLELAGIRQAARQIRPPEPLQVGGPYAWVRHPLYLGWILALFGTHHMTGDRLAFAALTSAYLVVAVPWAERSLVQSFGDEYREYARRVRWRLVPLLY